MLLSITGPNLLQLEPRTPNHQIENKTQGFQRYCECSQRWKCSSFHEVKENNLKQHHFDCSTLLVSSDHFKNGIKQEQTKKIKTIPDYWRRPLCETSWGPKTCTRSSATERVSLLICRCLLLSAFSLYSLKCIFQAALDEATEPWGIKVERVEM